MGGAVSSGRDNNELIDNLMSGSYIRSLDVEKVFRAIDRAEYMTPEAREQAYKDLAWRNGPLHLSSPCIYSEVMEGLELKPGLSFLNIGSGTGYLSTLAGLILGSAGINHGVEVHPAVVEYAVKKIRLFYENSPVLDDFDFCEPKFYQGNGLCLNPLVSGYDRVYCGAACPAQYEEYFKKLIKVGGVLVMPLNDTLLQVRRVAADKWSTRSLLSVSFATLRIPTADEAAEQLTLDKLVPVRLQFLARAVVRAAMRLGVTRRNPILREKARPAPPAACPRRICIPIEPEDTMDPSEDLNLLHDLNSENGANEMNALLNLVISMGQSRVAGALRFERHTPTDSEDDDHDHQEFAGIPIPAVLDPEQGNPDRDDPDQDDPDQDDPDQDNPDQDNSDQDYPDQDNPDRDNPRNGYPGLPDPAPGNRPADNNDDEDNGPGNGPRNGPTYDARDVPPAYGPRFGPIYYDSRNGSRIDSRNDPRNDPRYIPRPPIGSVIPSFEFLDSDDDENVEMYINALNAQARAGNTSNTDASRPGNTSNTDASRPGNTSNTDASRPGNTSNTDASRPDNGSNTTNTVARPDEPGKPDGDDRNPTCSTADDNSDCNNQLRLIPERDRALPRNALVLSLQERPSTSIKAITETANSSEATDSIATSQDTNGVPPGPDVPDVPSEVEIELATPSQPDASTSTTAMEWEETSTENVEASEDDTDTSTSKPKRQKLDSGIGEPSVSSPEKTKTDNSDTDSHRRSDCPTEGADDRYEDSASDHDRLGSSLDEDNGHHAYSDSESDIESDSLTEDSEGFIDGHPRVRSPSYWQPSPEELAHQARMQRRLALGGDARRVRLSILMKRAVRELPLPYVLKKFVNLGRCFEF